MNEDMIYEYGYQKGKDSTKAEIEELRDALIYITDLTYTPNGDDETYIGGMVNGVAWAALSERHWYIHSTNADSLHGAFNIKANKEIEDEET